MAGFSRRKRGGDEYLFVDGKAMRADEVLRFDVSEESSVPGQAEAQGEAAFSQEAAGAFARQRASLRAMADDDAFGLRGEATETPGAPGAFDDATDARPDDSGASSAVERPDGPAASERVLTGKARYDDKLFFEDRRQTRKKCLILGGILLVAVLFSLCVSSESHFKIYSPLDVIGAYGEWFRLRFVQISNPAGFESARMAVMHANTSYGDITGQTLQVFKYAFCGVMLAVAGALYQNTFRNPIAAPSMLGVSNGMSLAMLLLVLIYGTNATAFKNLYFLFSYIGGALVLLLVIIGGSWMSGKGRFSVVNMLLVGTIVSQLAGVIMTYVQSYVFTDDQWIAYYELQTATNVDSWWGFASILIAAVVTFVPVIILRFQLNLVSFSDAETKLLGIDPEKLRALALVIGSFMVLTAQVNTGQVSMVSLIVPFLARALFGAEFRKQLAGTCLIGALVLLVCGDLSNMIYISNVPIDLGSIVTIVTLPLFVWMLAIQQRAWE